MIRRNTPPAWLSTAGLLSMLFVAGEIGARMGELARVLFGLGHIGPQ